ncbi:MAG: phosphoadenosine phosphosulfate reductase family protein [Deltaproteobacteria bacterium]|nr:phosphoadenosine phosphosulfate reductase family protein [Deltaproteobacteria bacterium]
MPLPRPSDAKPDSAELLDLREYEKIIVSFSGGKDSTACVLHLLDLGVPRACIELWHQCIDGDPKDSEPFFDWPVTEAYVEAFAQAMEIPLLYQWREGGIEREMLKQNQATARAGFELPDGNVMYSGGTGGKKTRLKFPAPVRDLRTRWCTPILKIDVDAMVYTNDPRFKTGCTVVELTGERRQESGNRAKYAEVEPHKSASKKRRIEHWRAVIDWTEEEVWDALKRHNINPHPCYHLGWSRCSCFPCIFGDPRDFASVREIDLTLFRTLEELEETFRSTIRMDRTPIGEWAKRECKRGCGPYVDMQKDRAMIQQALSQEYNPQDIFVKGTWKPPRGAFGHSGGPV